MTTISDECLSHTEFGLFTTLWLNIKEESVVSGSTFGKFLKLITFGESHGNCVGMVLDGVKPGLKISKEEIEFELLKRRPSDNFFSSGRRELDEIEILSGIFEGKTTGHPICIIVRNRDAKSGDYENLRRLFRPGHADFTIFKKYGIRDYRGGGRLSGRETVGRVIAGAICKKILKGYGIEIYGGVIQIGDVRADKFQKEFIMKNPLRFSDARKYEKAKRLVEEIKKEGDSIGGVIKLVVEGLPVGIGDPVFDKLDALLCASIMSIGSVKGVEIGAGFKVSKMKGSENNDEFGENGFKSNNSGGILGGISNGDTIEIKVAIKPTPSIFKEQFFLSEDGKIVRDKIRGRHDVTICPRVLPVAEAMVSIVLADRILYQEKIKSSDEIEKKRMEIDLIDVELLNLISDRLRISKEIFKIKRERGMPLFSKEREEEILKSCKIFSEISEIEEGKILEIYEKILEVSKKNYE